MRRSIGVLVWAAAACERAPSTNIEAPPPAVESPPAAVAELPTRVDAASPAPKPVASRPAVASDESFAALATRRTESLPATDDAHAIGFKHLRAGDFDRAQDYFALAAIRDLAAWKHPFNLACAAAREGDGTTARIALVEAVRRGGDTVAGKARRDGDLAPLRAEPWFEPVLRGEAPPLSPSAAPATEATPPTAETDEDDDDDVPPKVELPRGSTKPIAEAQLEAIVALLEPQHFVAPVVRASVEHVDAAGEPVGWLVYQYSRYQACLGQQAAGNAQKKCRAGRLGECTDQWIVRAAPTDPPVLGKPQRLRVGCTLAEVRRLDALDLDGDDKDEILVDVTGSRSTAGFRQSSDITHIRHVQVLRLDGSTQLAFGVELEEIEITPSEADTRRFELRDDNGDGHADMIVFGAEIMPNEGMDDELWPEDPANSYMALMYTDVWLYDAKKDRWIEPRE